jgi:hypothetical protein
MNQECKNQYLKAIIEKRNYFSKTREEKSMLLDEYCKTTGLNRNYVIRKIQNKSYLKLIKSRNKKEKYDEEFKKALIQIWNLTGCPCGQKLEKILKNDLGKLIMINQLEISADSIQKLKQISSSTIDLKLREEKKKRQKEN